jgi:hypothetical protein
MKKDLSSLFVWSPAMRFSVKNFPRTADRFFDISSPSLPVYAARLAQVELGT